jgi:hypothetical protein
MKRKKMSFDEMRDQADALVVAIKPMLAGKEAMVIGAALAELVALLIAGHDENTRSKIFELHVATVLELYPLAAAVMRPDAPPKKETP